MGREAENQTMPDYIEVIGGSEYQEEPTRLTRNSRTIFVKYRVRFRLVD
jgi:hypothetical protein